MAARRRAVVAAASCTERQQQHHPTHTSMVPGTVQPRERVQLLGLCATRPRSAALVTVTRFDRFYEPLLVVLIAAVVFYGTL